MQTEDNQNTEPVDIPPVSGPFAEPWSLKKVVALAAVFGSAVYVRRCLNFRCCPCYVRRDQWLGLVRQTFRRSLNIGT